MSISDRSRHYLAVLGAVLLLTGPNIVYFFVGQEIASPSRRLGSLVFQTGLILVPLALFYRNIKLYFILLLPFALLSPLEMFFLYLYRYPLNIGALGALVETNGSEALEFLAGYTPGIAAVALLVLAHGAAYLLLVKQMCRRVPGKAPVLVSVVFLIYSGAVFLTSSAVKSDKNKIVRKTFLFERRVAKAYPAGVLMNGVRYWIESSSVKNHQKILENVTISAAMRRRRAGREVYVVIIGEAGRFDHFSINGYARDTSPLLRSTTGLISYSDVCSVATNTRMSLPLLMTGPRVLTLKDAYREPSFLTFFKKAGFMTHWISNQARLGYYETLTSVFAQEADRTQFLSRGSAAAESADSYDAALLPEFNRVLSASSADHLFVVLHTMGSHWRYDFRNPEQYDIFTPSMRGQDSLRVDDPATRELKTNSYDNSIVYTDYFISTVIKSVSSSGVVGGVLYVSDHGEDLFDDERLLFGHGNREISRFVAQVPLFVWLSDSYKAAFPEKAAVVARNKDVKISAGNLFSSVLDMADIGYPGEMPARSIFSSALSSHKRTILSTENAHLDCDTLL